MKGCGWAWLDEEEIRSRVTSEGAGAGQVYSQGVTDRKTYRTEGWSF